MTPHLFPSHLGTLGYRPCAGHVAGHVPADADALLPEAAARQGAAEAVLDAEHVRARVCVWGGLVVLRECGAVGHGSAGTWAVGVTGALTKSRPADRYPTATQPPRSDSLESHAVLPKNKIIYGFRVLETLNPKP